MTEWTEERIEELKALKAEGLSITQIGLRMGISRNAVVGKLKRLGLTDNDRNPIGKGYKGGGRKPFDYKPPRNGAGVRMLDLRHNQCRWPLWGDNERPTFRCCGEKVEPNSPNCQAHMARARQGSFHWTDGRVRKLEALMAEGITDPGLLAHELGTSKHVIIDRIRRESALANGNAAMSLVFGAAG